MALVMIGIVLGSTRAGADEVTEVTMKPKVTQAQAGTFHPEATPALLVGRGLLTGAEKRPAAFQPLLERLQARYGSAVSPAAPAPQLPSSPYVLIGLAHDHPALARLIAAHHAALPKKGLGPEGYALEVTPDHILIAAERPAGAFYGALQLLGLDTATAKDIEVPAGLTLDWPDMAWRGIHLLVNGRFDLADLETLLTRSLPQLRMNGLILELDYHFQFKSHPEMADGDALTSADCRQLKELADRNFVRLIPMINCLGHQSWAKNIGRLLKAHPEFDETPDAPADNKGIYCRSWCPSNPDVNRFVCDLIDEMVDAFHADAFHVGMDEVFILGQCPRCKGKANAHLFAKAVNDLHAHIVGKRKLQMLMWGDRFLDGKATGYGEWEASENGTPPAIDLIPKDIVLCDWHYETRYDDKPATYPSIALFQQKGLKVWPSAWRSVENVQLLVNACQQGRTDRMVGYLATTWNSVGPIVGGLEGNVPPAGEDRESSGLVAAIREGAKLSWEGTPTAP
jgi:hypothetical protein